MRRPSLQSAQRTTYKTPGAAQAIRKPGLVQMSVSRTKSLSGFPGTAEGASHTIHFPETKPKEMVRQQSLQNFEGSLRGSELLLGRGAGLGMSMLDARKKLLLSKVSSSYLSNSHALLVDVIFLRHLSGRRTAAGS